MRSVPLKKFYEAIGIDTHPSRRRSLWGTTDWERSLIETGVVNARGMIGSGAAGRQAMPHLERLFRAGVKFCATVAPADEEFDLPTIAANIDFLAENVGAAHLCGIESANEYNKPSRRPSDWVVRLRHFQAWLYETVKANPKLRGVPIVGPSIWGRLTSDIMALGSLEPYLDKSCLHYYTGGRRPTMAGRPSAANEGGGAAPYSLADAVREARTQAPTKPLYVTEFGYPVAGPGLPLSGGFITETAAAKYLIRGLFDLFGAGAEKIFIYVLIDDVQRDPPRYHGLMSGSLARRKTFYALKNLMTLMRDAGVPAAAKPLELALSNSAGCKTMLFQRSDGAYLLSAYQDVDSYDRAKKQDIQVRPTAVGLTLPRAATRIEVFTPTVDLAPRQTVTGSRQLTFAVGDHPTIVRIVP